VKLYNQSEAEETLSGLLAIQDKMTLARELAKLVVKYVDTGKGWTIRDIDLSVLKQESKFSIKLGNEE
jgi:hypothetical protein